MEKNDLPSAYGVFKPIGHVVVSFPGESQARAAFDALRQAGFADADVVHYTGPQMVEQADRDIAGAGVLASLGQELNLVKAHRELALQGSSFLVVHAPSDELVERVADVARRFDASRAQSYGRFLIEELVQVGSDDRQVGESPDRGLDAQTHSGREQN